MFYPNLTDAEITKIREENHKRMSEAEKIRKASGKILVLSSFK